MRITITDPRLLAQLAAADCIVELADPPGNVVARTINDWPGKLPPGVVIPWTEEEMTEMQKQRSGRPLTDVIRDLEALRP
jgi:hypothetical protein